MLIHSKVCLCVRPVSVSVNLFFLMDSFQQMDHSESEYFFYSLVPMISQLNTELMVVPCPWRNWSATISSLACWSIRISQSLKSLLVRVDALGLAPLSRPKLNLLGGHKSPWLKTLY